MVKVKKPEFFHNDEEFCTKGCGRRNTINALTLGRSGAELLLLLHSKFGGQADQPTMNLKGADYATISRTRYWNLTDHPEGTRKGTYRITDDGYAFMAGDLLIHHTLYQFDGRIVGQEGPMLSIADLLKEDYKTYEQVIATVRAGQKIASRELLDENIARKQDGLRDFDEEW